VNAELGKNLPRPYNVARSLKWTLLKQM